MSEDSRSKLFSFAAVLVGLVTAACIFALVNRSELKSQKSVEFEFRELSSAQQKQLVYLAERFSNSEPKEQKNIRELHMAVTEDSALRNKLVTFHSWWEKLERDHQEQLKSDGTFQEDWCRLVESVYEEDRIASNEIIARSSWGSRSIVTRFTEQEFEDFLSEILPQPLPPSLQQEIAVFGKTQTCEITLTKFIWFFEHLDDVVQDAGGYSRFSDKVKAAAHRFLFNSVAGRDSTGGPSRMIELSPVPLCLKAAVRHYDRRFYDQQDVGDGEGYVAVYDQLDSSDQLGILKLDTGNAKRQLRNHDLANNQSSEIADRLSSYYKQERDFYRRFYSPRGRFGGPGDRRPGERGGPGRGGPGKGKRSPGHRPDEDSPYNGGPPPNRPLRPQEAGI